MIQWAAFFSSFTFREPNKAIMNGLLQKHKLRDVPWHLDQRGNLC